jgi:uncharacterized protein
MIRFSPNPNRAHLIQWLEWGDDTFRIAQEQNKPVMLFLSAFWCRYCQRMDEEAFSETENIALLRSYFVSIREENARRPDIDVRYNQNGWPTIVFMTPQGEPIVAANYLNGDQFQDLLLRVYMGHQQAKSRSTESGPARLEDPVAKHLGPLEFSPSDLMEIAGTIMETTDRAHGGYGAGQKFIQPEPSDFLLFLFETTKTPDYLNHVCLTLERMSEGAIHDRGAGGYFRTSTGPDWDQPHREKLLAEQAGLILICLRTHRITQRYEYARMAEDIIGYLNARLFDNSTGAFYGCEDFLRTQSAEQATGDEFFTIIDRCVYTDANAVAIVAYLDAAETLRRTDCKERALRALEIIWDHCRAPGGGMFHYYLDGASYAPGLLSDQVFMGSALLKAYKVTGKREYRERAKELAEFVVARFKNPAGGYFDLETNGYAYLSLRMTLIEQNGPAASFFLALMQATGDFRWREATVWALSAFKESYRSYGIYAAAYGKALGEYLAAPKLFAPPQETVSQCHPEATAEGSRRRSD